MCLISLIHCDRISLAKLGKTTDVLLECDTWGCHKFPVAVHVFEADLAQDLANGNSRGRYDFQAQKTCYRK